MISYDHDSRSSVNMGAFHHVLTTSNDFSQLPYTPSHFKEMGYALVDRLTRYLEAIQQPQTEQSVLSYRSPDSLYQVFREIWDQPFNEVKALQPQARFLQITEKVLQFSNHLHHPRYMGHQVASALPVAALSDLLVSFLNNSTAVYEMAPVSSVVERILIEWMSSKVGYDPELSGGYFTSGGTIGNITALLVAAKSIESRYPEPLNEPWVIFLSEQAHYSIQRAIDILGPKRAKAILIPTNDRFQMDIQALELQIVECSRENTPMMAVVGSACTTATGSYDDLKAASRLCQTYGLWFHVDGAHGASALLSQNQKDRLEGVELADSLVWDAHKMMMMPSLLTAVIFKDQNNSYLAFSQEAGYLLNRSGQHEIPWYNLAERTMECTKPFLSLKLYISLLLYGPDYFESYIDHTHQLAQTFYTLLQNNPRFSALIPPQSNIVCFRYLPDTDKIPLSHEQLNQLQAQIRERVVSSGTFFLVQTTFRGTGETWLRTTLMNPATTQDDLEQLMASIKTAGMALQDSLMETRSNL